MSESISITNSLINTARDCWHKYYLEYVRRLTPKVIAPYFVWGSMCHLCDEGSRKRVPVDVETTIAQLRSESILPGTPVEVLEQFERFSLLLPLVLDGFFLAHHVEDEFYENITVEQKFEIPIPGVNGYVLRGKIDGIIRDIRTGEILVRELKTAAQTGATYWNRLPLDLQIRIYVFAAQEGYGFHTNRVMYDVWKKPQAQEKLYEGESAEEWAQRVGIIYLRDCKKQFERKIIEVSQKRVDNLPYDLRVFIQELEFHESHARYPQHHPGSRKGGCDYFKVCTHGEEADWVLREFYTRKNKHPELEGLE